MSPAVSIVLPTWNRLDFLREAVNSVLAQTVSDWELIVADDGSTDDTVVWLQSLGDSRIVVLRHEHTGHRSMLRNAGLSVAKADWVAFLDSDDRWTADKLERQLAYHAANPRYRWSYTNRRLIDADGHPMPTSGFKPWAAHSGWILPRVLTHDANIALPSVMAQRSLLEEVGGFNLASWSAEDYELWLRLSERFECGVIEDPLLDVRKHKTTSFQRPEVDLAFAEMFRQFARRTADAELRRTAQLRAAFHACGAAERLAIQQRWPEARRAFEVARDLKPLAPFVYRVGTKLLWRRIRSVTRDSTAPSA